MLVLIGVFWIGCFERWMNEVSWQQVIKMQFQETKSIFMGKNKITKKLLLKIFAGFIIFVVGKICLNNTKEIYNAQILLGNFILGLMSISIIDLKKQVIYTESILIEFILCISYLLNSKVILEIHVYGSLVGLLVMGFIYFGFLGGMGSGDVYLNTILGLWLGFPLIILCIIIAFMLAGIVGVYYLVRDVNNMKKNIPFAPFLSVASLISFYWGAEIIVCYQEIFS